MSVIAIFSGFAARIAKPRKQIDPRAPIMAALQRAMHKHDTREIHRCRKALKRATTDALRAELRRK